MAVSAAVVEHGKLSYKSEFLDDVARIPGDPPQAGIGTGRQPFGTGILHGDPDKWPVKPEAFRVVPLGDFLYPLIAPPEAFRPFGERDASEAERHSQWFVGLQAGRFAILQAAIQATEGGEMLYPCRQNLKRLWTWVVPHVAVNQAESSQAGWEQEAGITNREMTAGTLCLAVDIGFFLAATIQSLNGSVAWTLWEKSRDYYYQRPVLDGIGRWPIVPHDPVMAGFWRVVHSKAGDDELTKVVDRWMKRVPSK